MELLKALTERRAKRAISSAKLPDGALELILEAGTLAPSCFNSQSWRIVAATEENSLPALREALATGNAWAQKAPAIIVITAKEADDCRLDEGRDYALFDAGLYSMALMAQATAIGLIAHPIAGYKVSKVRKALDIPKDQIVITLIIVGMPGTKEDMEILTPSQIAEEEGPRTRKPMSEVIFKGTWGQSF